MNIYFSENIKRLRLNKGLTQERLADFLGVAFQTVSKWERGESHPDITILPEIADFFGVSLEELLGINKAKKEQELEKYLEEYDNYLNDAEKQDELIEWLIKEYPSDFRVKLRYMVRLFKSRDAETFSKVNQIYDNIMSFCTNDSIRISAKKYLAQYYHSISYYNPELNVTYEDVMKILDEMPSMRDGREYLYSYLNPDNRPECKKHSQDALELELCMLYHGLYHYVFFSNRYEFPNDLLIEVCEKIIDLNNYCFDDGNYGKMWRNMLYTYIRLSELYFKKGEVEKAYSNLEICAKSAKRLDTMERVTIMKSRLFNGREFDKDTLGSTFIAATKVKEDLTGEKSDIPEKYKETDRFKEILGMLE